MRQCCIKDCDKLHLAGGLCAMHYRRQKLYGDPTTVKLFQMRGLSLKERWEAYTEKGEDCWLWVGSRDPNGYGRLNINGRPELAHRLAWRLFCSEITSDQHVLHKCDNPSCVRPDHLFLGDQVANNADMKSKGRYRPGVSLGEAHGCAKLTEDQVREIRASSGPSELAAKHYGISGRQVRDIRLRRSWRHLV